MQIQISLLLQKPTDLDLHCLLRQGMLCLAREGLNALSATFDKTERMRRLIRIFTWPQHIHRMKVRFRTMRIISIVVAKDVVRFCRYCPIRQFLELVPVISENSGFGVFRKNSKYLSFISLFILLHSTK